MLLDRIQLESDEKVITITRRHKISLCLELLSLVVAALIPVGLYLFLDFESLSAFQISEYLFHIVYGYGLWLLILWIAVFVIWTDYYLDVLVVTNRRLVIVNHKGFFWRNIGSFRLNRLQDVNIEINGLLHTFFDYGNIRAETAGHSEEEFHMEDIPDPRGLKSIIMNAIESKEEMTYNQPIL